VADGNRALAKDVGLPDGDPGREESGDTLELQLSSTVAPGADSQNVRRLRSNPGTGKEKPSVPEPEDHKKEKDHRLFKNIKPKHPFTFANQLQRTLLNSWINILFLAAPVGIALNYVPSVSGVVVFVVNFIAIIPLAAMLSFATEEIALRTGETLGGLLNATFG
jgi:Ca2+:H+ antiporter